MAPLDVMPLRPSYEHIPSHVPVFDPDKVMLSLVPSALLECMSILDASLL